MPSDKVYRHFESSGEAENFLSGNITLRSSYFYEILEYAGDTNAGDALERTRSGFGPELGASTWISFVPKFLFCCSNSRGWKDDVCWVDIDSSEVLYRKIQEQLCREYSDKPLLIAKLSCVNVKYLDAKEIHKLNLRMHADLAILEHDPEKWEPVFREDHAQTKT